jgi:uncharacterized protein with FMN-binding domain
MGRLYGVFCYHRIIKASSNRRPSTRTSRASTVPTRYVLSYMYLPDHTGEVVWKCAIDVLVRPVIKPSYIPHMPITWHRHRGVMETNQITYPKGSIVKNSTIRRFLPLVLAASAAVPTTAALASPSKTHHAKPVATRTYKGSAISTVYGPLQVKIVVKKKKIIDVKVTAPTHTARSAVLDNQALPILRQEALRAQSASINQVSGATTVSEAYIESLQSAIAKAGI